jgi:MFS family permease
VQHGSRRAGLAAMLAAAAFSLGNAAIGLADPDSDDDQSATDYAAELALSAALIGAAAALLFLRQYDVGRSRRVGGLGWSVAVGGAALAGVANFFENGLGVSAFGLLFALGGLALLIGLLTASIAVLTTASPWRWAGLFLLVLALGIAVGHEAGFGLVGLTWIALAAALAARAGPFRTDEIARDAS